MVGEVAWMMKHAALSSARFLLRRLPQDLASWWRFWKRYMSYKKLSARELPPSMGDLFPVPGEDRGETSVEPIYFYQDVWAFDRIVQAKPSFHVDIGSHHKFVALLSKVVPLAMVDIRPLSCTLESLSFCCGSILQLPFKDSSLSSVSCICVVEHIGLGRYGDPLDPRGTQKAVQELKRIVKPGGDLYMSVPVNDRDTICYDAHRAFAESTIIELFLPFEIVERRYIFGNQFVTRLEPGFGTGCYHFRRP